MSKGFKNSKPNLINKENQAILELPHDEFLWGVATSPYQHEGGLNGEGEPLNNWAWAEKEQLVEPSGKSCNFWNLAEEDLKRASNLGLNAFRLGLCWSRIQPTYTLPHPDKPLPSPPPFDTKALMRYCKIIASCRALGMEPIITLHHFTHPAWLGLDAWLHRATIDHYLQYVGYSLKFLLEHLPKDFQCKPPQIFLTVNEPNMLATCHYLYGYFPSGSNRGIHAATLCLIHLLEAHTKAYFLIHSLYKSYGLKPYVSFNNYASNLYWLDLAWLDLLHAPHFGIKKQKLFSYLWDRARQLDTAFNQCRFSSISTVRKILGILLKKAQHFLAYACSFESSWKELLEVIYHSKQRPFDFIAFDYYDPFVEHALRWPRWNDELPKRNKAFHEWLLEAFTSKWWDWKMLPEGLVFITRQLAHYRLALLISENGLAYRYTPMGTMEKRRDSVLRSHYIRAHVRTVQKLRAEGSPLFGYLYWSLVDNYEWGSFSPRFGLYSVDFKNGLHRNEVDVFGENPARTYAEEIYKAKISMAHR
ncbi:glycoside hydrolase family 1 protein [Candidatus Methylacidiphilum infernorum]|uniref:glycoside hydrolase family 1 protein n=1 Tax=Candidatus Methylacidiphilum infernorum TaxID=511746 RepID=UPI001F5CB8DA|nr:family 1 glycosylhydrolase [Candidatus Methylacidiphilum infernorum]